MLLVEAGRKTEIGQLDVTLAVEEDVVRLDVSAEKVSTSRKQRHRK